MDRQFAYTGAIPQNTDILSSAKNALYGIGHLIEAAIGSNVGIAGLAIAPTGPASLSCTIGRGSIYQVGTADASAYGDLGTDANSLAKQGINPAPVTLTVTAPGTSGYSQYYLVQVSYTDTDGGATVLPYFNSANPSAPYAGPANAGTSNNTVRKGVCNVALKAGTAAATGSETIPAPDAGYSPAYVIHVTNGQTTITSTNWYTHPSAPFFPNLESLKSLFLPLAPANTFYVNASTGNDANDGLSATASGSHGPFATIQGIVTYLSGYTSTGAITINVAAGTYGGVTIPSSFISSWKFVGAGVGSCTISSTSSGVAPGRGFIAGYGCNMEVSGFAFASYYENINIQPNATALIHDCNFSAPVSGTVPAVAAYGGFFQLYGTIVFATGTYSAFIAATNGGYIEVAYFDVYVTRTTSINFGTSTVTNATVVSSSSSTVVLHPTYLTLTGTVTGVRFNCTYGGAINTSGSGVNYIPGSSAGTATTGYYS
jgi:hypothetical protein